MSWNKTSAAVALSSSQEPNGSFLNNLVATTESVVAASALLNGLGILSLRRGHCNNARKKNKQRFSLNNYVTDEFLHHQIEEKKDQVVPLESLGIESPAMNLSSNASHYNEDQDLSDLQAEKDSSFATTTKSLLSTSYVVVRYWLWIGTDPPKASKYNVTLHVPENTNFFTVMQRAAEINSQYE